MQLQLEGLIPIGCGVYSTLLAHRIIPLKSSPERTELWHRKFGRMMKILGPFLVVFGLVQLSGVLDSGNTRSKKYNSPCYPEVSAAADQLSKGPPGMERYRNFIGSLKVLASHTDTPPDLKQALNDYITSTEEGVDAMQAGRDLKPYNDRMTDAKKRILTLLEK